MVRIIGYVTESHGREGFTIKITEDYVDYENKKQTQVSKKAKITIHGNLYPHENSYDFVKAEGPLVQNISRCRSISEGLKKGDRVMCSVLLVEQVPDTDDPYLLHYKQNNNHNDILSYARSELLLYPNPDSFKRLEVDTSETLKFRKKNYYMDKNRQKCVKIIGNEYHKYNKAWWINKNPKLLFMTFNWLRIKTKVSKLWKVVKDKENLQTTINVILAITTIISIIVAIFK